jgi:hypothetical protein
MWNCNIEVKMHKEGKSMERHNTTKLKLFESKKTVKVTASYTSLKAKI